MHHCVLHDASHTDRAGSVAHVVLVYTHCMAGMPGGGGNNTELQYVCQTAHVLAAHVSVQCATSNKAHAMPISAHVCSGCVVVVTVPSSSSTVVVVHALVMTLH